jgi:hypothetical protein
MIPEQAGKIAPPKKSSNHRKNVAKYLSVTKVMGVANPHPNEQKSKQKDKAITRCLDPL